MSYDIIGDIHGYADPLKALLKKMDYQLINGAWKHPAAQFFRVNEYLQHNTVVI